MLRDILRQDDPQAEAALDVIAAARADVILLSDVDYDHGQAGLGAIVAGLAKRGLTYGHRFAAVPNAGIPTELDLDGDGRLRGPRDALGYGRFSGDGGLAILSRFPLGDVTDLSERLWRDLPGSAARQVLSDDALAVVPVSSIAQWIVPVDVAGVRLSLMTLVSSPPVFDGPEDRNGLRNRDELRIWQMVLDGAGGVPVPEWPVLLGHANLDPLDGQGHRHAITALLEHPMLQDPRPRSAGGAAALNPAGHRGDPALDTANWQDGPGPLRVDYILPSASLRVVDSGVLWPGDDTALGRAAETAGAAKLVWVDLWIEGDP